MISLGLGLASVLTPLASAGFPASAKIVFRLAILQPISNEIDELAQKLDARKPASPGVLDAGEQVSAQILPVVLYKLGSHEDVIVPDQLIEKADSLDQKAQPYLDSPLGIGECDGLAEIEMNHRVFGTAQVALNVALASLKSSLKAGGGKAWSSAWEVRKAWRVILLKFETYEPGSEEKAARQSFDKLSAELKRSSAPKPVQK